MIIDYKIVQGRSTKQLQEEVMYYLNEGYDLQGGMILEIETRCTYNTTFYQTLIRQDNNVVDQKQIGRF